MEPVTPPMVRGCNGKTPYETVKAALRARRAFLKRVGDRSRDQLTAYYCQHCGSYHLGRNPKQGRTPGRIKGAFRRLRDRYEELSRGEQ